MYRYFFVNLKQMLGMDFAASEQRILDEVGELVNILNNIKAELDLPKEATPAQVKEAILALKKKGGPWLSKLFK